MSASRVPAGRSSPQANPNEPLPEAAKLSLLKPHRPSLRVTTALVTTLAVLVLFGLVGFQALIVRHQGRLDDLDVRVSQATTVNQRLRLEVAQLEAPDRIRTIATAVLGMVDPAGNVSYLEPIPADQLVIPGGESAPG